MLLKTVNVHDVNINLTTIKSLTMCSHDCIKCTVCINLFMRQYFCATNFCFHLLLIFFWVDAQSTVLICGYGENQEKRIEKEKSIHVSLDNSPTTCYMKITNHTVCVMLFMIFTLNLKVNNVINASDDAKLFLVTRTVFVVCVFFAFDSTFVSC